MVLVKRSTEDVVEIDDAVDGFGDGIQCEELAPLLVQSPVVQQGKIHAGEPEHPDGHDADKVHEPRLRPRCSHDADDRRHADDDGGRCHHLGLFDGAEAAQKGTEGSDGIDHGRNVRKAGKSESDREQGRNRKSRWEPTGP